MAEQQMPDLLPCSGVTQLPLVLFRVTCSDSCTHVKLTRHHFTLRCPYAAQLLPVTLVRLQLWQQNRVNDSQTSPTKCALQIQMTSYTNRLCGFGGDNNEFREIENFFQISEINKCNKKKTTAYCRVFVATISRLFLLTILVDPNYGFLY